jgi:hypothetical protein
MSVAEDALMRNLILASLLVSGLLVLGCSRAELSPIKGPDGQEWVAITCSHGAQNCWKAAADFCPNGYETADEVQSTHGFLVFKHTKGELLARCTSPLAVVGTARSTRSSVMPTQ